MTMKPSSLAPLVLLSLLACGCMRWRSTPVPSPGHGDTLALGTARVTTRPQLEGFASLPPQLVLRNVQMRGDSLVGWGGATLRSDRRIAVHRDQVTGLELRRIDWLATVPVVVLSVVSAGVAVYYHLMSRCCV